MTALQPDTELVAEFKWIMENVVGAYVENIDTLAEGSHAVYLSVTLVLPLNRKERLRTLKQQHKAIDTAYLSLGEAQSAP